MVEASERRLQPPGLGGQAGGPPAGRGDQPTVGISQRRMIETHAMAGKNRLQFVRAAAQLRTRMAVGVFGEAPPVGVAEDIGEEDHRVVARRLEQHDVGVGKFMGIAIHADLHARLDERAEGLRQDGDEPFVREPCWRALGFAGG